MFGFNWIDAIIIILLVGAVAWGRRVGFVVQVFVLGGFFGALFLGGWLFPHLLPIHDRTILTIVNVNLVLLFAVYVAVRAFDLGHSIHWSFGKSTGKLKSLEAWLGVLPSIAALLVLVWLLAAMIGRLPFAGFSNSADDALIVQTLDRHLPSVPAVLAVFDRAVNPNSQPRIFVQPKPQPSFLFSVPDVQAATAKASASIVRITSFGCGGLVSGSGFMVAPDLVATNAHVVAGVKRPIIKYDDKSYAAVAVLFDPNLDFAVLRVQGLNAPPLALAVNNVSVDTSVAVLGYPGGNYTVVPGIIRDDFNVFGRNIYDVGVIGRDVYEIQASINAGSSGGPIVLSDGRVAGIIFSKSNSADNDAYALVSSHLLGILNQAKKSYRRVSTGVCLAS